MPFAVPDTDKVQGFTAPQGDRQAQSSHFNMEEFKGRQLVAGRRPQDVQEDVRQLGAIQKADSRSETPSSSPTSSIQNTQPISTPGFTVPTQDRAIPEAPKKAFHPGQILDWLMTPQDPEMKADILGAPPQPTVQPNQPFHPGQIIGNIGDFARENFHDIASMGMDALSTPMTWLTAPRVGVLGKPNLSPPPIAPREGVPVDLRQLGKFPGTELTPIQDLARKSLETPLEAGPTEGVRPGKLYNDITPGFLKTAEEKASGMGKGFLTPAESKITQSEQTYLTKRAGLQQEQQAQKAQSKQALEDFIGVKPEPPEPKVGQAPPAETASKWKQWWNHKKMQFGAEGAVLGKTPDSPVISAVESHHVWPELQMENLAEQPWVQALQKRYWGKKGFTQWKNDESQAVRIWKENGRDERAYNMAIQSLPQEVQQMFKNRDLRVSIENEIRGRNNLPKIPLVHEPYFPRTTTQEFKAQRNLYSQGLSTAGKENVGPHASQRFYETMKEGIDAGTEYKHPLYGFLSREANGYGMQATDQMITGLKEAGVLNETKSAALANSPTGEVIRIKGFPLEPKDGFWVRTKEEGEFLRQNLAASPDSSLKRWANTFFRGPNLINPAPHVLKNMAAKLAQQTIVGSTRLRDVPRDLLVHVPKDIMEYRAAAKSGVETPVMQRFKQVMPFTESGKNLHQIMLENTPREGFEKIEHGLSYLNKWSQSEIFAKWDPAMRYAKWMQYVRQGMSDQEAANHTWIDLIRYGRRGDIVDFWKSLPANFFVHWRVGTVATLRKAFQSNSMRLAAFIGLVDGLREIDNRYNNMWFHMPHDYAEKPVMTLFSGRGKDASAEAIASWAAGPGGEFFLRSIETLAKDAQLKDLSLKETRNMFWGIVQLYGLYPAWEKYQQDGSPKHLADIALLFLLGRHPTPYGAPPRLYQDVGGDMLKSPETLQAERKGKIARGELPEGQGIPHMGMKK